MERKLVSVRVIKALRPIPGADNIECATVDGWNVVVKKGEFKVGDLCVYFEIDSFLPYDDDRYDFLRKLGSRVIDGFKGIRLRTVRLRGQLSQGLALPVADFYHEIMKQLPETIESPTEGLDLTDALGIKKYEPPIEPQLRGQVLGKIPWMISKTDQERVQNIVEAVKTDILARRMYEVTVKLDGVSTTFYRYGDHVGVCSRTMEFKDNVQNSHNFFVKSFRACGIKDALLSLDKNDSDYAIQGELMGPGIRGNREDLATLTFFVFDVWSIRDGRYLSPAERKRFLAKFPLLKHVPVVHDSIDLSEIGDPDDAVESMLRYAEGKSLNNRVREGLVFKRDDGNFSFKVISNSYLLNLNEKD